ncbi:MAG TPA: DivIVA domain-containing protein [Acidimicrobiales bacterium]|jgi:DivIVA domain-containing protein|nr:DivIVA domain-containing protein [Acidimicrobiales bacterium]
MDSGKPSGQGSSLDSLRTVEFRQTLRGYHIDDVDEYLERVAVDAEALQEQVRQAGDRLKQAAERIAQLEGMLQEAQVQPAPSGTQVSDDTLQRTLLLAQKFVDQTHAEAEAEARVLVADAEERARRVLGEAEQRAKSVTEDTERHLREEITRLESVRTQLAGDVETIARHMENERNRLRGALSDMLNWVDEHVQPTGSLLAQRPPPRPTARPSDDVPTTLSAPRPGEEIPTVAAPDPVGGNQGREPSAMTAVPVQGNAATGGARAVEPEGPTAEPDQGVMPMGDTTQPQAISPR